MPKRDAITQDITAALDDPHVRDTAKTLLTNVRLAAMGQPWHMVAVTSAGAGEGKTFVASALSEAVATSGETCVLVECDLRRRSLASALGVHPTYGMWSVMAGKAPLTSSVVPVRVKGLYLLDAGPHLPNPTDILSSSQFDQLLGKLSDTFDHIILDTPPIGSFVDAMIVARKADVTLFVIRDGVTRREDAARAIQRLREAGANVSGAVLDFTAVAPSDRHYEQAAEMDQTITASAAGVVLKPTVVRHGTRGGRYDARVHSVEA